ncbi:hypothetical protein BN2476_1800016 [Paraburkholderia piptadeniae]|uniref:Uncharacterized protein n=1 Tax=Paraburkholderia piptadeniae TaxID=1701573 RepID=A0A1N7SYN8_9BURK|nr:hypothetical protein BN2476_1800016 [Paraburkholderia piptadeniae]
MDVTADIGAMARENEMKVLDVFYVQVLARACSPRE